MRYTLRKIIRFLLFFVALIVLVEEWLWHHTRDLLIRILSLFPLERLKKIIVLWITDLPPYAALFLFIGPFSILIPLKLAGLSLLAHGHWILSLLDILLAKILGMAFSSFLFTYTRPQLLKLNWFKSIYELVNYYLKWAHHLIRPFKDRAVNLAARLKKILTSLGGSGD